MPATSRDMHFRSLPNTVSSPHQGWTVLTYFTHTSYRDDPALPKRALPAPRILEPSAFGTGSLPGINFISETVDIPFHVVGQVNSHGLSSRACSPQ